MPEQTTATRLSRDVILDACVRIADRDGPDAVTMRRLGGELNVDPTAVYRHFRDKNEMVSAMADRLLFDVAETFVPSGGWREDLRSLALAGRQAYMAHPQIALILATAPALLANTQRVTELCLGALRAAGLEDDEATTAFQAFENYVVGSSALDSLTRDQGDTWGDSWRRTVALLPADAYPNLAATAPLMYRDDAGAFEYGLDLILEAIEARLRDRGEKDESFP